MNELLHKTKLEWDVSVHSKHRNRETCIEA